MSSLPAAAGNWRPNIYDLKLGDAIWRRSLNAVEIIALSRAACTPLRRAAQSSLDALNFDPDAAVTVAASA